MFGCDLAALRPTGASLCGAAHGAAATAMFQALSEHHGLPVDHVRAMLSPMFPEATPRLHTPDGWSLFAAYIGADRPDAGTYMPAIH